MTDKKIWVPKEFKAQIPKIYWMNDCDHMIAYSKKEAVNYYFNEIGPGDTKLEIALECERVKDLSQEMWWNCFDPGDLWERAMNLEWDEKLEVGKWGGDPAFKVTFKYVIEHYLSKIDIPGIICSTEY